MLCKLPCFQCNAWNVDNQIHSITSLIGNLSSSHEAIGSSHEAIGSSPEASGNSHKVSGRPVLKHCSSLEAFSSRPGASDISPKTSGSSHQAVGRSHDASCSTSRSIDELFKIKRNLDLLELWNFDEKGKQGTVSYFMGIKLARNPKNSRKF